MVLDKLNVNHIIQKNPFATPKVAFTGQGTENHYTAGVNNYGTGKGINAENSTGVLGEVTGTGQNGKHLLNTYF